MVMIKKDGRVFFIWRVNFEFHDAQRLIQSPRRIGPIPVDRYLMIWSFAPTAFSITIHRMELCELTDIGSFRIPALHRAWTGVRSLLHSVYSYSARRTRSINQRTLFTHTYAPDMQMSPLFSTSLLSYTANRVMNHIIPPYDPIHKYDIPLKLSIPS